MLKNWVVLRVKKRIAPCDLRLHRVVEIGGKQRTVGAERGEGAVAGRKHQSAARNLDLALVGVLFKIDDADRGQWRHVEGIEVAAIGRDVGVVPLRHDEETALRQLNFTSR